MRPSVATVLCLMCAGCSFILGGPDYAQVDQGALTIPTPTGGTGGPRLTTGSRPLLGPDVIDVATILTPEKVSLQVRLMEGDGDLMGGTLVWTDGVTTSEPLSVPADLDVWRPREGVGVFVVEDTPSDCSVPTFERTYAVQVTDAAGLTSDLTEAPPLAVQIVDAGPPGGSRQRLGDVTAPALMCGTLGPDEDEGRWDSDHHPGGVWSVTLTFDSGAGGVELKVKPDDDPNVDLDDRISPQTVDDLRLEDGQALEFDIDRYGNDELELAYQVLLHR